jgi:hypothetical protein
MQIISSLESWISKTTFENPNNFFHSYPFQIFGSIRWFSTRYVVSPYLFLIQQNLHIVCYLLATFRDGVAWQVITKWHIQPQPFTYDYWSLCDDHNWQVVYFIFDIHNLCVEPIFDVCIAKFVMSMANFKIFICCFK